MLIVDIPKEDNCAECELVRTCAKMNGVGVTGFIRAKEDGYFTGFCVIKGELVRCGECEYHGEPHRTDMWIDVVWCNFYNTHKLKDGYCNCGERKGNEDESND